MKTNLLLTILLFPVLIAAQTDTKPPKLRIEPSFLSTKYELGDKTTPKKEVALHLKQYESDAYIKWKAADRSDTNGLIWSILGFAGTMVGIFSEENETSLIGYSTAVVGFSGALICSLNSKSRRQSAIDIYNRKYGY